MTVRNAVLICLIVEAGLGVLGIINYGYTVEALQATTRFSGRFSLLLFSIVFLANRPTDIYSWLSKKPFHVFALAHGIHLLELLTFLYVSDTHIILYRVAGGFVAYSLIFIMPLLADRLEQGRLEEKKFNIMIIVFQYFVWGIFFLTYLPRVRGLLPNVGGSYMEHVVLLGWISLMLGMKLPRVMRKRKVR
ncbi:MAG: hypothetical protein KDC93_02355 [Cyclobacteriaceae bacterium]|nr:hypothetical protein [Cyclobacteriaceae bacterium]